MPSRIIREGWVDSDAIDKLSAAAERFFLRLCLRADDWGRFQGDPRLLRSALFPLRDDITIADVVAWTRECTSATNAKGEPLVASYQADGKCYLVVLKHGQRRRPDMRPKFPDPPPGIETACDTPPDYTNPPRPAAEPPRPAASGEGEGEGEIRSRRRNPKAKAKAGDTAHRQTSGASPTITDAAIIEAIRKARVKDYADIATSLDLAATACYLTNEQTPKDYVVWSRRLREIGSKAFQDALCELYGEAKAGECENAGAVLNLKIKRAKGQAQ